jgi:hypothetical protein
MTNRVRWVKGNPDASDAAPTVSNAPVSWERASKVLTMDPKLDADDTNPVPAVARKRLALVEATEEVHVQDVLEVAAPRPPSHPRSVSVTATCEIQADDVLEEVTAPKSATSGQPRERKTDPPEWRTRKTVPPAARDAKTDPPAAHGSEGMPHIPLPAPLPSTPPWVADARTFDPRREPTKVHLRPDAPRSRAPWLFLGAAVGASLAVAAVIVLAPSSSAASAATSRVPTLHHLAVKHPAERIGHGPTVPVLDVGALPRR